MSKATHSGIKKKMGRPRVGSVGVMVRVPPDMLADLDRWRHDLAKRLRKDPDSRPEAIRAILEGHFEGARSRGLRDDQRKAQETKKAARHIAAQVINDLADPSVPADERAKRKGRLLKGPGEFRGMRDDQPKSGRPKGSKK